MSQGGGSLQTAAFFRWQNRVFSQQHVPPEIAAVSIKINFLNANPIQCFHLREENVSPGAMRLPRVPTGMSEETI